MSFCNKIIHKLFGHDWFWHKHDYNGDGKNIWKCSRCGKITKNKYKAFEIEGTDFASQMKMIEKRRDEL